MSTDDPAPQTDNDRDRKEDPFARGFPTLPIVTPDPARRPAREKYGALFYLGGVGLAVVVTLVSWFVIQAWVLREVWTNVYVLHDANYSEAERVEAAYALARDPRVNQRMLWEIALRRSLPSLGRYAVAEALTAEAAESDPRGYGTTVVQSEGWPVWLRLLLTRPMAYSSALDLPVARESLATLAGNSDRPTALWAIYALAEGVDGEAKWADTLRAAAKAEGPNRDLAVHLVAALDTTRLDERLKALDTATLWLRTHHPDSIKLWNGWKVVGDHLVPAVK